MEPQAMPGGIYSNVQAGSMLGLEISLQHPLPPQNPHHHMLNYGHHPQTQQQQPAKQAHPVSAKSQIQTLLTLSDDDDDEDPGFTAENSADDGKKKIISPWQRMKWTDNMVKLLIMVVFYIGDEVVSEANNNNNDNKKKGGSGGGGVLQKKGKWKSVSRTMLERGFYVSPQQCEDKFNDLNKRYKRVNDILGKGISCRVVENQSLLDTMDHLPPKLKDEVKKLLHSKHLFFREMCAYHNSCGHGGGGGAVSAATVQAEPPPAAQSQRCLHSTVTIVNNNTNDDVVPNLNRGKNEGTKLSKGDDGDDDDDDGDDDDGDDYDYVHDGDDEDGDDDDDGDDIKFSDNERRKRLKKGTLLNSWPLDLELDKILEDGSKSEAEKRRWMKTKMIGLEEERVGIQSKSFEIEKQRLKWLKFSSKKEREMERDRLTNERLRLENERMVLIVRQKELDLIDHVHHHHHLQQQFSNRKSDPSSITG